MVLNYADNTLSFCNPDYVVSISTLESESLNPSNGLK